MRKHFVYRNTYQQFPQVPGTFVFLFYLQFLEREKQKNIIIIIFEKMARVYIT